MVLTSKSKRSTKRSHKLKRKTRRLRAMRGGKNPRAGEFGNEEIFNHPNVENLDNCLVNLNKRCIESMDQMIKIAMGTKPVSTVTVYNTFFGPYTYHGILGIGGSTNLATLHLIDPSAQMALYARVGSRSLNDVVKTFGYVDSIDYIRLAIDVKRTAEMYSGGNKAAVVQIKQIVNDLRNLVIQQILNCGERCESARFKYHLDRLDENILYETCSAPVRQSIRKNTRARGLLTVDGHGVGEGNSYGRPGTMKEPSTYNRWPMEKRVSLY